MVTMKICEWICCFLEGDDEDYISFILACGLLILTFPSAMLDFILFPFEFIIALITYFIENRR